MLPISVCMIVKNEEKKLARCLDSIKDYGFEIVIVDTGSTDQTKEIASKYTKQLYEFSWTDNFSEARNCSLKMATNNWILMLDADETLEQTDLEELQYFMQNLKTSAGAVTRRNQVTIENHIVYQTDHTERFFSRMFYHYEGRIHEQLTPIAGGELNCLLLNTTIWHDGYDMTDEERRKKGERNLTLLFKQMDEEGETPYLLYQIGKGYEILEDYAKACTYFDKGLSYQVDPELAYVQEMVLSYGDDLLRTNQTETAYGLTALTELFPNSADFYLLLGRIYEANKEYRYAIEAYQTAIGKPEEKQEGAASFIPAERIKTLKNEFMQNSKIAVFTATHVKFMPPTDPVYIPLQVGREGKESLGYLEDNIGDHISDLNALYGELTGLYWIWRNIDELDYAGLCHYRRYFVDGEGKCLSRQQYLELLLEHDVIMGKHLFCEETYREYYGSAHTLKDLNAVEHAIQRIYPEYLSDFQEAMRGHVFYSGNLMVTSLNILKTYAEWLFTIFAEASEEIDVSGYDSYHRRVYGFLSEQMLFVFVKHHKLDYMELPVGISAEKAETIELKAKLALLLNQSKPEEAQLLFQKTLQERPDVLLRASDLTDELRQYYQIIHLCLIEQESSLLAYTKEINELLLHYRRLREILKRRTENITTQEDEKYLLSTGVSNEVLNEIVRYTSDLQKNNE